MTLDASGRLGIGTSSPQNDLHVNNASSDAYIRVTNSSGTRAYLGSEGTKAVIYGQTSAGAATPLVFNVGSSEAARIDSSSRLLVGTSTNNAPGSLNSKMQVEALDFTASYSAVRNSANTGGPQLVLGKSRGLALNSKTSVISQDNLGSVNYFGADGNNFIEAASIQAFVDGTPGSNDMPGRLVFSTTADGATSPTERFRIANTGKGSYFSSSSSGFQFSSSPGAGTSENIIEGFYGATGVATGTLSFLVRTNGNVLNANNSYGSLSDLKLKENIVDATSQWSDIKALQVRKYNFKEGQTHTQIGLIAQEVELVSPGLVSESPDRDEEGNDLGTVTKSVNYSVLYMKAVKALQEAMERIEQLETEMAEVKAQLS